MKQTKTNGSRLFHSIWWGKSYFQPRSERRANQAIISLYMCVGNARAVTSGFWGLLAFMSFRARLQYSLQRVPQRQKDSRAQCLKHPRLSQIEDLIDNAHTHTTLYTLYMYCMQICLIWYVYVQCSQKRTRMTNTNKTCMFCNLSRFSPALSAQVWLRCLHWRVEHFLLPLFERPGTCGKRRTWHFHWLTGVSFIAS